MAPTCEAPFDPLFDMLKGGAEVTLFREGGEYSFLGIAATDQGERIVTGFKCDGFDRHRLGDFDVSPAGLAKAVEVLRRHQRNLGRDLDGSDALPPSVRDEAARLGRERGFVVAASINADPAAPLDRVGFVAHVRCESYRMAGGDLYDRSLTDIVQSVRSGHVLHIADIALRDAAYAYWDKHHLEMTERRANGDSNDNADREDCPGHGPGLS